MAFVTGDQWVEDVDDAQMHPHHAMGPPTNNTKAAVAPVNLSMNDITKYTALVRHSRPTDLPQVDLRNDTSMSGLIAVTQLKADGSRRTPGSANPASPDVGFTTSAANTAFSDAFLSLIHI